ncbi:hypothetical protein A7A76_07705 [Lysobacter enzymogenes]|uniref:helix-turn-helix domain-containing protein n=1 Tax=Lysobacter enzymogenes TaxID=69 RepID=UPI0019D2F3FE|nr:helix-turn-helix domain-containing protein [Lysobacter enzymogenes]MBN7138978.1 hypothetical protein [Lysobacter enzymogenes]
MSTMVMSACWPLQMPPTQKAVLISLADNADDRGFCFPSLAYICTRTCFGKTAVIDAIRWLEQEGYLEADRSNGRHTRYQVIVERDLSGRRTGPRGEPVRQADRLEPEPVREANRSAKRTGPAGGPNLSASRTEPVRQADTNRQEPSRTAKEGRAKKQAFKTWIQTIPEGDAIPATDPIYAWAEKAGIPDEWLTLAWLAFEDRYSAEAKQYADWRAVFRNAVKGNWLRLWWSQPQGGFALTTVGETWRRVQGSAEAEAA